MAVGEAPNVPAERAEHLSDRRRIGRRLPRSFYDRRSSEVAPDLLGRILVGRSDDGNRVAARIVETEAYEPHDPASHAYRGRTERNATMFGPPGHLYVYFTYGMHHCMNAVTGPAGEGMAVLLRAAQPVDGLDVMRERRGRSRDVDLCSGPARLCQAFGVDRSADGIDLVRGGDMWIADGTAVERARVAVGPRVGIRVGLDHDWRFSIDGDPYVSRARPGPPATGWARTGPSTR